MDFTPFISLVCREHKKNQLKRFTAKKTLFYVAAVLNVFLFLIW